MRLVIDYRGGALDGEVARVYNSCMSATGFVAERTMSTREVRELWFGYSTFDPSEYAMAVSGGRVLGIVFARVRPRRRGYIWMCLDMGVPIGIRVEAALQLLSWAGMRLRLHHVSTASLWMAYEHSWLAELIRGLIGVYPARYTAYLMRLRGGIEHRGSPGGCIIRRGGLDDVAGVVSVYNEAFRGYPWFEEWRLDDAVKWYRERGLMLHIAVCGGEVAGYVDYEVRRGLDGRLYGYIYTLAVREKHRGKGLGSSLLAAAVEALKSLGVEEIYLDALPGLENYYARYGFTIIRRAHAYVLPVGMLPAYSLSFSVYE